MSSSLRIRIFPFLLVLGVSHFCSFAALSQEVKPTKDQMAGGISAPNWPEVPVVSNSPEILKESPTGWQPTVGLRTSSFERDPLIRQANSSPLALTYAYSPHVKVPDVTFARLFFMFHDVNLSPTSDRAGQVFYTAKFADFVWDVQFSPRGSYVIFKVGDPYPFYATYQVYIWDLAAGACRQIPNFQGVAYRWIKWSPDESKFAYITGGDREGQVRKDFRSLELHIFDLATNENIKIVTGPAAIRYSWTPDGRLLYSQVAQARDGEQQYKESADLRTDVYEFVGVDKKPRLLLANAFSPETSPDLSKIAFLGWPLSDERSKNQSPSLYIYDLQSKLRKRIFSGHLNYFAWLPNGESVVVVRETSRSEANQGIGEGKISKVNIKSGSTSDLTTLTARDFEPTPRSETWPQFEPRLSRDGQFLLLKVSEFTKAEGNFKAEEKSLWCVNMTTGKSQEITRILNRFGSLVGWDWCERRIPASQHGR